MLHPKTVLSVLGITTLLVFPVAPGLGLFGADAAFAGNGNDGGNGNGGGNGNAGGNGNGNSGGASGDDGGATDAGSASHGKAVGKADGAAKGAEASGLGNMNGAMNANINAVLAHIRNGNTNGPVGILAALVAADARLGDLDAAEVLARAEAWSQYRADLVAALGGSYPTLDDYLAAQQAQADYPGLLAEWQAQEAAYQAALEAGDPEAETLNPGEAPSDPGFVEIASVEQLLSDPPEGAPPSAEDIAAAEEVTDAEQAVLAMWNKNPGGEETMTEAEQALLDSLRSRFSDAELQAIAAAAGA